MSTSELTYPYEVILLKPNKADPAATRAKTAAGMEVQRKHDDLKRYALEGVKVEDESIVLRFLEWTSYDGHMRFRASPLYPQFQAVREGAVTELISLTHFEFFGPASFDTPAPVYEVIDFTLKPTAVEDWAFFKAAMDEAFSIVGTYSGLGYTLGWQKEDPTKVLGLIGWQSVDHHMKDFRGSGDAGWNKFLAKFGPLTAKYLEVREMYHIKTNEVGKAV